MSNFTKELDVVAAISQYFQEPVKLTEKEKIMLLEKFKKENMIMEKIRE